MSLNIVSLLYCDLVMLKQAYHWFNIPADCSSICKLLSLPLLDPITIQNDTANLEFIDYLFLSSKLSAIIMYFSTVFKICLFIVVCHA